ncbi:MAG TPA: 4Fe-4S binding protein, partial [Burkholderiales bacterium]
ERLPHYAKEGPLLWLAHEAWDHLWPWSRHGFRRQRFLQALSLAVAVVVTTVWVLAASGHVAGGVVVGWWAGWSVFEIMVRMQSKFYVKAGPWWRRNYRPASPMDMICYVSFKNLLIGAVLFLTLKSAGLLIV